MWHHGPRWPSGILIGLSRRRDRFDPGCRLWVYTSNHRSLRRLKLLDSSLVSLSARYDLINFDLWPGIVCPEKEGLGPALQRACEHTVVICTTTITSPRSYQLGNIALHSCQVGWKKGSRSPKDSNLCWCDTRLSVVCPPQMVKNQYEVFVRNKQTNKQCTDLLFLLF